MKAASRKPNRLRKCGYPKCRRLSCRRYCSDNCRKRASEYRQRLGIPPAPLPRYATARRPCDPPQLAVEALADLAGGCLGALDGLLALLDRGRMPDAGLVGECRRRVGRLKATADRLLAGEDGR